MTVLSRGAAAFVALVAALVLFIAVNVIADKLMHGDRIDLTQEHLYTLSKGSIATIDKIEEPITLRFYFSHRLGDEVPSYGVYAQRVRELLDEYKARGKGKIDLRILDPEPFSETEDKAVAYGLKGAPITTGGEQVYFGLVATNSTDDQQVIPFFQADRERFLEYDITKLIHGLASPKKTVVGIISTLPLEGDVMAAMQGRPMQPFAIDEQLQQLYTVRNLTTDVGKVANDVDVLMVVASQGLSDKTLYAIDQFALKGGKVLLFTDPYSETALAHPNPLGSGAGGEGLDKLLAAWGVDMMPKVVAGDRQAAVRVAVPNASGRREAMDYLAYLDLKPANLNRDNLITADLAALRLGTAGILEPHKDAKTKLTPLIFTSTQSMAIPADKVQGVPDVASLLHDFKSDDKALTLAAEITGPADTAFPDGPPPAPPAPKDKRGPPPSPPEPASEQVKSAAKPINVVVIADTDLLDDRFWVQTQDFLGQRVLVPTANNGDLVANAIELLGGGEDLISLRSRGSSQRPFEVIDQLQRTADERDQAHERELQDKLKATQDKIKELQVRESGATLAAEQTKALDNFRAEMIGIRQQLRRVQHALIQDISWEQDKWEFIDIALIPILVALAALFVGILRQRRRQRRPRSA